MRTQCPTKAAIFPIDDTLKAHHLVFATGAAQQLVSVVVPTSSEKAQLAEKALSELVRATSLSQWPTLVLHSSNLNSKALQKVATSSGARRLNGTSVFVQRSDLGFAEWVNEESKISSGDFIAVDWLLEKPAESKSLQVKVIKSAQRMPAAQRRSNKASVNERDPLAPLGPPPKIEDDDLEKEVD
jgi:hypothetical protein